MVPAMASGNHGKPGCCGGLPDFGSLVAVFATVHVPAGGVI